MATRRYMTNRGETDFDVTESVGAATATKKIELTVDLASSIEKGEVLLALDRFYDYILTHDWPPA